MTLTNEELAMIISALEAEVSEFETSFNKVWADSVRALISKLSTEQDEMETY